jgi:aarF domain-containing kinase
MQVSHPEFLSAFAPVPALQVRPRASTRPHRARPRIVAASHRRASAAMVASAPPATPARIGQGNRTTDAAAAENEDAGLPAAYDMPAIAAYWDARPGAAARRLAEVIGLCAPWLLAVAVDARTGSARKQAGPRAAQLRDLLVRLGPCFIKLGQALSVRPDLVGPDAMNELRVLCDAVPSFPSEVAFRMIEEELGKPVHELFSEISPEPIAAASLGQVYKARLRSNGKQVAVKVQRPDMLRKVSLDLYCLQFVARMAQDIQRRFTANQTDYLGLLDEWARGTYKELDYINEASNSRKFAALIQPKLPKVYVPAVYSQYTSRKVLTMEWVNGRKLSDCSPEEIRSLVGKGVECFLVQFLSAGFFHSDPHSANLFCLDSGDLCIIDFGLMATIDKIEMDAMVSAIVHLANRDYKNVVHDFVALKFLLPSADLEAVESVIGPILDQALEGGGAESINFQTLSDELASVTFDFPFRIPPAFALLLRSLSVLEGIALIGDPKFKLIMEAFPFVSRLILTDRSPALRTALRQVLYKDGAFSPVRLRVLLDSSQGIVNDGEAFVDFDSLSNNSTAITQEAIELLFSDDGLVLREIISEEIAKSIDVLARDLYDRFTTSVDSSIPTAVRAFLGTAGEPRGVISPGQVRNLFFSLSPLQFLLPGKFYFALPPVSTEERQQLENIRLVADWLSNGGQDMQALVRLTPEIVPKSAVLARMVAGRLGETFTKRLFDGLIRGDGEDIKGRRRVLGPKELLGR